MELIRDLIASSTYPARERIIFVTLFNVIVDATKRADIRVALLYRDNKMVATSDESFCTRMWGKDIHVLIDWALEFKYSIEECIHPTGSVKYVQVLRRTGLDKHSYYACPVFLI